MTADDRLRQALSLGSAEPPAFDALFAARVAEQIEQRRFLLGLCVLALWAAAGGVLIWALRPVMGEVLAPVVPLLAPTAGLAFLIWLGLRMDVSRTVRRMIRLPLSVRF